jgi:hypothetical protein
VAKLDEALPEYRRFRMRAARTALLITAIGAGALFPFSRVAAAGAAMGGAVGVLGFWIMAVRLEKIAASQPEKIKYHILTLTYIRFLLYGLVLYRAFLLDQETYYGLMAAVGGIFVIRIVLSYFGIKGVGMKTGGDGSST